MTIKQLGEQDERALRRAVLALGDSDLAMHRQLKDYFLAPTGGFGTAVADVDGEWVAIALFSRYGDKAYIHHYMGDHGKLSEFVAWLNMSKVQAFFKDGFAPQEAGWQHELAVTPGFIIDHPAYNGVFSRVAPRFKGNVYEYVNDDNTKADS